MKTNKIQLNKKALIKTASGILSFVLTANMGLNLLYENACAREIEYDSNRNIITLSSSTGDAEVFYLMEDEGSYFISDSLENPNHEEDIYANKSFTINENCTLVVLTDYQIEQLTLNGGDEEGSEAVLIVNDDVSVNLRIMRGTGLNKIINYGEIVGEGFSTSSMESNGIKEFHNEGQIEGRGIGIDSDIYSDVPGASLYAHDSFSKDDRAINAVVEAGNMARISSTGGSFKLIVGEDTIEITGPVDGVDAYTLFDDPEITLDEVPDFFVGQSFNFSPFIHTADGYSGTPYIEYSYSGEVWTVKAPTSSGEYYIRAVAPNVGTYRKATSSSQLVRFSYLSTNEVFKDGKSCTISGVVNDVYVPDELIITPPEGYKIASSHDMASYGDEGQVVFRESLSFSEDEIVTSGGSINQDVMVSFRSDENDAITRDVSIYEILPKDDEGNTVWDSLVFDSKGPNIIVYKERPDLGEIVLDELSIEESNAVIAADTMYVSIQDEKYISNIDANVDGVETNYNSSIRIANTNEFDDYDVPTIYSGYFYLYSTPGKAKQVTITATDGANNVSTLEFTLIPENPIDPELEVTLPEEIYVGDEYEPDIETNSDSEEIAFEYFDLVNDTELEEAPTAAGSYMLRVTLGPTDLFNSASFELDFEILKYDFEADVSVANIYVDGTVNPVLSGVPEDYEGTATFKYKLSTDEDSEYSSTVPSAAGTYTVQVTFPDTDDYSGMTCTDEFTISKYEVTATVSVADIYVGGTLTPVLSIDPEGYNGEINYEYKLSVAPDTAYSTTVPSAAGKYTVRVTLAENYKYLGTTCTDTFTISKNDVSATVTVADIYVGGTVNPVLTVDPEDYDNMENISYEYKLSTEEDSEYSFTVPSAAGTYTLLVTLPATDTYVGTTCTTEFTISKNTVTATVSVNDVHYGEDYEPVVETVSTGDVTFYYRDNKQGADSPYLEEKPTAVGSYTVVAEIAETDKYNSITCSDTFEILKATPVITITVPENIYAGEDYVIEIETNSDAEPEKKFYKDNNGLTDTVYFEEPGRAGNYIVIVSVAETDSYEAAEESVSFTVNAKNIEASVTVSDIFVGETPSPVIEGIPEDYDGTVTYAYKLSTAENSDYSTTVPSAAGEYTVRATLPATDLYSSVTCTDTFTISKNAVTATVTVADIFVGGTVSPILTVNPEEYDGVINYEYKLSTDEDTAYSSVVPTTAGAYTVKVTLPETNAYLGTTCTDTFTISKKTVTATVSAADIYVGETVNPVVSSLSGGTLTLEYKPSSADDTAYSTEVPVTAGEYTVRATIAETTTYLSTTCTDTFTISKRETSATVSVEDIHVGEEVNPELTVDPENYNGAITYEYKKSSDEGFSTAVPTAAGTYTVRATLSETNAYLGTTCTDTFTISKNTLTATVSVENTTVGGAVTPVVVTVPTDYNGTITYEYKSSTAESFSSTVPTAAGTYTVRATLASTDTYLGTTCTSTFTISKKALTATVTVADVNVSGKVTPVVTTDPEDYNGTITYEYKSSTDEAFSSTVPTTAGTYTVRATLAETAAYLGTTCTGTFTINKNIVSAEVSVANIFVGDDVTPAVTTDREDYNGTITYEYKSSTDEDFSSTVPTAAGTYTVRATLAETAAYLGTTCTGTFTISKRELSAAVSVKDIYVGEVVTPELTVESSDYSGTITYEYKLIAADEFSTTVPTAAGAYTVRATLAETDKYLSTTCTSTFTISRNALTATVSVEDTFVGIPVSPAVSAPDDYNGTITYEYKSSTDEAFSSEVPTAAGTYSVRATLSSTDKYLGTICDSEFTIKLNPVTKMDLKVADIYYGQTVKPVFDTNSNGTVTIMYKPFGSADSEYTTTLPSKAGKYTARAVVNENNVYESASCTVDFSINYLESPETTFNPSGTAGKNGYFTSDVTLNAPEGYQISAKADGPYTTSIPYTEDLESIYLKRTEDNALTDVITITNKPNIDKAAPVFTSSEGTLSDVSVIYDESITVTVNDKNLTSLTINGEAVDLSSDGSNVLTLTRPATGYRKYIIVAEDAAGNKRTIELTLMAEWLRERVVPEGLTLPLTKGEIYYLDEGPWSVVYISSDGTITENTTIYSGNIPFYVNADGDYIFTRVK